MGKNLLSDIAESEAIRNTSSVRLWQVNITSVNPTNDRMARRVRQSLVDGGVQDVAVVASRGFLIQGDLTRQRVEQVASEVLVDSVVESFASGSPGDAALNQYHVDQQDLFHVLLKPGVMDPEADTVSQSLQSLGFGQVIVRSYRQFVISRLTSAEKTSVVKLLANDSIEQLIEGPIELASIELGHPYEFRRRVVHLVASNPDELMAISRNWQLSLTLPEMERVQAHFRSMQRDPTDVELETIAQTWSEHCSHKTLAGRVEYTDEAGTHTFQNLLKETIFAATMTIRQQLGPDDWCVSVFQDNAGVVAFDDQFHLTFKVETHNRPSALEPYGGANTGIGGVIRDTLGTGLGAKPICNTDVFCFAPPDVPHSTLPPGVLHPRRIMNGVVEGVRDYGNRMGIPTVNGAVYFDQRYLGNPLVFCGSVGLLPKEKCTKQPQPGDLIVVIGGRTGRDGIHGATFSSAELTDTSDVESGGAVQIGNAITEKMLMDVLLQARDQGLFNAVTDCGAGGFSSAVGEMGEAIGAEVWLDRAPLKYQGLSYTEIWISEAQERMVFAVPEEHWARFHELCRAESVSSVVIGQFVPTQRLTLKYEHHVVADLAMEFLHRGRPAVIRKAMYHPPAVEVSEAARDIAIGNADSPHANLNHGQILLAILSSFNVASKHWIIRQYDHEVQGGSVIKPLVGALRDGPSDAAVIRPRLDSYRGVAIGCGMNPHYGDHDTYHMAASAIDEAIRNCVAVGADPNRIAILDNFCWGYTDRPETLGSLVRAAVACHDVAIEFGTPFISGKDSLNNEFSYTDADGNRQTISIPSTLLISAVGQIDDVRQCVTMDLKQPGNLLYLVGPTGNHFGGSHFGLVNGWSMPGVPTVDAATHLRNYRRLHHAIESGWVRACHDCSEGGLAVAAAEMALAGRMGLAIDVEALCRRYDVCSTAALFSESNGRLFCEVPVGHQSSFEKLFGEACVSLGSVQPMDRIAISRRAVTIIDVPLSNVLAAWQQPLDWS